jgi:hypothetical protein
MTEELIKRLYHTYRHAPDFQQKGLFFSPTCMQVCRPVPSYAATTREQIVQYLKDARKGNITNIDDASSSFELSTSEGTRAGPKNLYTIRPLCPAEFEFGTPAVTSHVGLTPSELAQRAKDENWVGMRVDLWTEGSASEGLLVKVQYWWREETVAPGEEVDGDEKSKGWRQCFHDIMYLGPRDGAEGKEGLEILEWEGP